MYVHVETYTLRVRIFSYNWSLLDLLTDSLNGPLNDLL
jgi:hypothetical protein